jgi:hypothetical protein
MAGKAFVWDYFVRRRLARLGGETIYLAGIDDAHYYRVGNIEKAAPNIPPDTFSILLSHTPEVYRHAAHAICLPGSIPLTLSSVLPRRFGSGAWKYHNMVGYTSSSLPCSRNHTSSSRLLLINL